jgi:glycosyltransferase involved in cell wall biosynthesis
VIIVDDCSTDESIKIIKNLTAQDSRFKLFTNEQNLGCGYTKNKCASLATGAVLGFLDPDDTLRFSAISVMIDAHRQNDKTSIVTSNFAFVAIDNTYIKDGPYSKSLPDDESYLTYGKGAMSHFASFKRKSYLKTVGIDPTMKRAVDQDLYLKMEEVGDPLYIDQILYNYRVNENSISANNNMYKAEYWHLYAKNNAFKRRKKQGLAIKNLMSNEISLAYSNHYLMRFEGLKFQKRKRAKFNLLLQSICKGGTHRLGFKFKSLVLLILGRI